MLPLERVGRPAYAHLGEPAMVLEVHDGMIEHWFPRPGFVVNRIHGVMSLPIVQRIKLAADRNADSTPGQLAGFGDWANLTNWDPVARELVWKARSPYWHRTAEIHLLVGAVSLLMARSAAMLEPSIHVHEVGNTYDSALLALLAPDPALQ